MTAVKEEQFVCQLFLKVENARIELYLFNNVDQIEQ